MQYTVAEVAEITKLSKVTIYSKLKQDKLKPHLSKSQGITYVNDEGLKLIKDSLVSFVDKLNSQEQKQQETAQNEPCEADLNLTTEYINYLKSENERLWNEMQKKNNQIEKLSQLLENGQVLLREKPQQDIQLLQEHCVETDGKIIQVRERMEEKKGNIQAYNSDKKLSIWERLTKKKKDY